MKISSPLVAAFAFFLMVLTGQAFGAVPAPAQGGKVVYVDGEATANGRLIETGDLLSGPVVLKTGPGAVLEVVFAGKNIFRLGSDTVIRVDFSELKKSVHVEQGSFTSVLKKLAKLTGSDAFVLRTPTVTAGVRGTSFHVIVEANRSYFCTCNGSVALEDGTPADAIELTNAHHGARIYTKGTDGVVRVTSGGLEGHTDASIETLAHRIGVTVDWSKPDLKHE